MTPESLHPVLKLVSMVVLALLLGAMLYAGWISVTHWSGIGV